MAEAGSDQAQVQARSGGPVHGRFQPGQSGNPSGRPRKSAEALEVIRLTKRTLDRELEKRLGKALEVVDRAMRSRVDLQVALRAAVDVLDRVGGKAVQRVEASFDPNIGTPRVIGPDDLRAAALAVLALQTTDAEEAVLKQPEAVPAAADVAAGLTLVDGQVVAK